MWAGPRSVLTAGQVPEKASGIATCPGQMPACSTRRPAGRHLGQLEWQSAAPLQNFDCRGVAMRLPAGLGICNDSIFSGTAALSICAHLHWPHLGIIWNQTSGAFIERAPLCVHAMVIVFLGFVGAGDGGHAAIQP